eukprot:200662_1
MKSFLLCGLIPLIHATKYYVEVGHAKDLVDEDADVNLYFTTIKRTNDPFVEILAFGDCGDSCIKSAKTEIEASTETPEWDEGFVFDEESDDCGHYEKLIFKLWDDDSIIDGMSWDDPDFLGETDEFDLKRIVECDEIYASELEVSRGGTLFVEISKDCDSDSKDESKVTSSELKDESKDESKVTSSELKDESKDESKVTSSELKKEESSEKVTSSEVEKELEKEKDELEEEWKEVEEELEKEEGKGGGGGGGGGGRNRLLRR